jgi:hypothetical protein
MAGARDTFKDLLGDRIAPWLRDRGFKRRDATFRRERDAGWQVVNFQRSRFSDAGVVRFTVSLGVGLRLLHEKPPWASRGWPLEYECDFRERLGPLHKGDDHWWRVRPMLPPGRVAKDVLRGLEDAGLSWLGLHATPDEYLSARSVICRASARSTFTRWCCSPRSSATPVTSMPVAGFIVAWQGVGQRPAFAAGRQNSGRQPAVSLKRSFEIRSPLLTTL